MKKVVLASLLACAVVGSGLPSVCAAQAAPAQAAGGKVTMSDAEYAAYNNAMTQTTPQAKAAAIEAYLTAYPNRSIPPKLWTLPTACCNWIPTTCAL
jgi:outer membrane lipoprotein-sorting protein